MTKPIKIDFIIDVGITHNRIIQAIASAVCYSSTVKIQVEERHNQAIVYQILTISINII